jgi:hypothetical protein
MKKERKNRKREGNWPTLRQRDGSGVCVSRRGAFVAGAAVEHGQTLHAGEETAPGPGAGSGLHRGSRSQRHIVGHHGLG